MDTLTADLNEFTKKYKNIKVNVVISDMSKETLIKQLNILIHKINADAEKAAPFKIKQFC